MSNKILSIKEVFDVEFLDSYYGMRCMDGFEVITERNKFQILISNSQNCCERWGYTSTEDDLNDYIGSELFDVTLVDTCINEDIFSEENGFYSYPDVQFVNFDTSNGLFQLAVYNGHNGYYGHFIVVSKDENILLKDSL